RPGVELRPLERAGEPPGPPPDPLRCRPRGPGRAVPGALPRGPRRPARHPQGRWGLTFATRPPGRLTTPDPYSHTSGLVRAARPQGGHHARCRLTAAGRLPPLPGRPRPAAEAQAATGPVRRVDGALVGGGVADRDAAGRHVRGGAGRRTALR